MVNSTNVSDLLLTAEQISGSDVLLTFKTAIGHNYLIQAATKLSSPVWLNVISNIPGTGNPVTVRDPGAAASRRFYRASARP